VSGDVVDVERILHEEASTAAGYDHFGDDYYREGLTRMLVDLERATGGGEGFLTAARFLAYSTLVSRLYSERGWQERPEVLGAPLPSPVVIVGIPRTATTMMHNFLSANEDFQATQNWLIAYPMIRPPRETWADYPEYKATVAEVESQPEHRHVTHFVAPDDADECLMLVNQSFVSVMYGAATRLPEYDEWMLAQDWTPSLRRHANNLRLIGADEPQRRWLLKNPSYVLAMRELFSVHPDAKVVWMHRDPQEAIGSLVDMLWTFGGGDPRDNAARELRLWSEGVRRTEEIRSAHEDAFFDVDYRQLMADPLAVSRRLFAWLDMDVSSKTEAGMRTWLERNPQGRHGVHRYDPDELGVSDQAVRAVFAPYMARYGLD
jgi:hypothetical protein